MPFPGSDPTDLEAETCLQDDWPGIFMIEAQKAEPDRLKKDVKVMTTRCYIASQVR